MAAAEIDATRRGREEAMKIRSSVNRRGFDVEPAGFFNVLSPSARFVASHLQRRFPFLVKQAKGTAERRETANPLQSIQPSPRERAGLRLALIVLAAIAITFIALWWIDGNLFARHFGF
jgi:hypothetical protein